MWKNINIGDRVEWRDQHIGGKVLEIQGSRVKILLDDGFTEWTLLSNLIVSSSLKHEDINIKFEGKHEIRYVEVRPIKTEEIDLHIEALDIHWIKIPKDKILSRQLLAFNEEIERCKSARVDELIVIHGKGTGVLKSNIISILQSEKNVRFEELKNGKYKGAAIKIYFS